MSGPKIVGRVHALYGNSLWELCMSLPCQGKGRFFIRNRHLRYAEPSVVRVVDVFPNPQVDEKPLGKMKLEDWFRGQHEGVTEVKWPTYKPEYTLVPRRLESSIMKAIGDYKAPPKRILPATIAVPPLLKLHLEQRLGVVQDRMPLVLAPQRDTDLTVQATADLPPTVPSDEVDGLGCTTQPHLYEGVDLQQATYPPPTAVPRLPYRPRHRSLRIPNEMS